MNPVDKAERGRAVLGAPSLRTLLLILSAYDETPAGARLSSAR